MLLGILSFFLVAATDHLSGEQQRRGSINASLGIAKSNDNEKGNFGLLKSIDWNFLSRYTSGGLSFGIVKNEILAMGNISLKIPINRLEPFATAGFGAIIESFSLVNNYGAGIRILLGKKIGIVAEYRKFNFTYKDKQRRTENKIIVDYFGAGIFYFF